jgi:ABC-type sugar transport system permease subunit
MVESTITRNAGRTAFPPLPVGQPTALSPGVVDEAHLRRRARRRKWADRLAPYLFIAPFILSFGAFFVLPSALSVTLSFARYNGYTAIHWVGIQNYRALIESPDFRQAVRNTLFYWLVPLVPMLGGALALALLVRSKYAKWPRVYRPLIFVPQVMAPVAAALVWRVILSNNGLVNGVLHINTGWLSDPATLKWSVVLLLVWRGLGWYFVVFLAGLSSISDEVLEAASVDGATFLQRIWYVVLPLLRPTILFALVIDTIASLQLFTEPNLLVGGTGSIASAPPSAAPVMNQVINNVTGGQFGLAAAVGWLMFVAIGVFSLIQFRLFREARQ